ncbi:hypothetical protein AM588_10010708 [Phytophthora nicotianae]|uniref:Uncharacterized protein n=1 Tax=Phytophthora nicotianae TaxID=4792 RepID=A0A0W8DTH5_PHYNI|nr:hypothetical protein AM588_10010708 [Phytophthora nicotianae]
MSEDEFVVLLEHAGILETSDENDMEFMEETVLREWLERDGVQLFTTQMTAAKRDQSDSDLVVDGSASTAPTATATATTLVGEARTRMAGHILARLLERGWIAPIEFDYDEDETEATQLTARGFHLRAHELRTAGLSVGPRPFLGKPWAYNTEQDGTEMPPPIPVSVRYWTVVADNDMKSRLREKMWQDCFPTCSESAKQTFLSFTRPEIILYATLGLNLISNGISSVPAFSRELKSMGVTSADDRSIIVGFLAKAFPTE